MAETRRRQVSQNDKTIVRHLAKTFGGRPPVYDQWHDTLDLAIGIMEAKDVPNSGITTYATVGLWETRMKRGAEDFPSRMELLAAFPSDLREASRQVLSAAAFATIRTGLLHFPGSVAVNGVKEFYPTTSVPHLYFTAPSIWGDEAFREFDLGDLKLNWLQVFPISDEEYRFLKDHRSEDLEHIFVKENIDIFDLSRGSAI